MKATRPGSWCRSSASSRSCHPNRPASAPGPTTAGSTGGATRSSACSADFEGFRRIFSRFEKLDVMLTAFIQVALIIDMICVNTP